jgi:Ca2+-transporting ATPase
MRNNNRNTRPGEKPFIRNKTRLRTSCKTPGCAAYLTVHSHFEFYPDLAVESPKKHINKMNDRDQISSYHSRSAAQVVETMGVEQARGLAEQEALRRLDKHCPNKLRETKRGSIWEILSEQFKSMVIIVLVIAGTVALAFQRWAEGIAIVAVLLVNAALGFVTEWKAMRSMEALREMGDDTVRVRRNGEDLEINTEKLVPGDIIVVDAGDIAPC